MFQKIIVVFLLLGICGVVSIVITGCFGVDKIIQKQMADERKRERIRNAPKPWKAYKKVIKTNFAVSNLKISPVGKHRFRISGRVSQCKYLLETGEGYTQAIHEVVKVVRPGGWTDYVRGGVKRYDFITRNTSQNWQNWMPDKIEISNPFGEKVKISVNTDRRFSGNLDIKNKYYTSIPSAQRGEDWYRKTKNISIQPYSPPHKASFSYIKRKLSISCTWYTAQAESTSVVK